MTSATPSSDVLVIAAADLSPAESYRLLTGIVVPRPIAWVTSLDERGAVNLAPFSAYTMVSNDPPMVGINIGLRDGRRKDTAANIDALGEYVVNVPTWDQRDRVHESGRFFAPEVDEAAALGLDLVPSRLVAPPRLAEAPISMECTLSTRTVFGDGGAEFTVGQIELFHVRADLFLDGKIETESLDPLARVAGPAYTRTSGVERLETYRTGPP